MSSTGKKILFSLMQKGWNSFHPTIRCVYSMGKVECNTSEKLTNRKEYAVSAIALLR